MYLGALRRGSSHKPPAILALMASKTIVAIGGYADPGPLLDYVLGLARGKRLLYVPTAGMENTDYTVWWYGEAARHGASMSHLHFFPWPPADLRERVLDHDVVLVPGGNTANMLAIWRLHGFDEIAREAWESGVVLAGWSAGAICWFDAGVTDSFGPELAGMDCLGLLQGSACPHYDGEERRRPRYAELLRDGFPPGIAIDDDVAVRFDGTELTEVVTARDGAAAYRVSADGEEPLEARRLA
jgi:dipeptidase E